MTTITVERPSATRNGTFRAIASDEGFILDISEGPNLTTAVDRILAIFPDARVADDIRADLMFDQQLFH